jgi:hypothetical protein
VLLRSWAGNGKIWACPGYACAGLSTVLSGYGPGSARDGLGMVWLGISWDGNRLSCIRAGLTMVWPVCGLRWAIWPGMGHSALCWAFAGLGMGLAWAELVMGWALHGLV